MSKAPNYYIVDAAALPEIFRKVVDARRMLDTGEAETVNQAVQLAGISRSAFYKYKDAVRPFQDMLHGRIVTFQIMLKDEPGILSHVLNLFAGSGANILTINQGLPINGCAVVTVNAETSGLQGSLQDLLARLERASYLPWQPNRPEAVTSSDGLASQWYVRLAQGELEGEKLTIPNGKAGESGWITPAMTRPQLDEVLKEKEVLAVIRVLD